MIHLKPVILCGGSGTRLWPISRSDYPKQFVNFPKGGEMVNSLFRYAVRRIHSQIKGVKVLPPAIIASSNYRFFVKEQLQDGTKDADIFLEPIGRNTAPSLTMAALMQEGDPILVVLPSDQAIDDVKLNEAIARAVEACEAGVIVLLGIKPTYPETGYGYIKTVDAPSEESPVAVDRFVEKPDLETAKTYLEAGTYLWNSGIFILKASTWLKALNACRPDIATAAGEAWSKRTSLSDNEITVAREDFLQIPSESVDFAVLEHCAEKSIPLKVIAFSGKWTDLGSWKSVFDAIPKDDEGNFTVGNVVKTNTKNSLVVSTSRPVVTNGIENMAVIETSDAVLVTELSKCQQVKELVSQLKQQGFRQAGEHRKGRRPWGWYDAIDEGNGFKVKRIVVNPGCSLSLQRHQHRAEHWTVASGEALVQVGETLKVVHENESVFIPQKEIHRLTNKTDASLTLIEVQIGQYLGEDDVERIEDKYGRI